jgi:hypothetical protein
MKGESINIFPPGEFKVITTQNRGMTPEEIIRVMKQTPRTKNSQGGLNYLMGL